MIAWMNRLTTHITACLKSNAFFFNLIEKDKVTPEERATAIKLRKTSEENNTSEVTDTTTSEVLFSSEV